MKQYYCFLERFNNYFNRKIIKYDSLLEYQNNSKSFFIPQDIHGAMTPFDFNPNDNVMTEIIVNDVPFSPDYFLLLDSNQNIVQRWFVLEEKRNRQGQWLYTLRRDVVSDNLETLDNAPIFVEKGMLPQDDAFIVNSEGMNLNQIKKDEKILKDKSETGWLVGYIAKNKGGSDINVQASSEDIPFPYITLEQIEEDLSLPDGVLSNLVNFNDDQTVPAYFSVNVNIDMYFRQTIGGNILWTAVQERFSSDFETNLRKALGPTAQSSQPSVLGLNGTINWNTLLTPISDIIQTYKSGLMSALPSIFGRSYYFTDKNLEDLKKYEGSIIRYNGKFYNFYIKEGSSHVTRTNNVDGSLYTALNSITADIKDLSPLFYEGTNDNKYYEINTNEKTVYIQLQFLSDSQTVPEIDLQISSGRAVTQDQEYDIIAIPLNCGVLTTEEFKTDETYARRIISAIALELDASLYDMQLLPYCPVPSLIDTENHIDASGLSEHIDYDLITKNFSNQKIETVSNGSITFNQVGMMYTDANVSVTLPISPTQTPYISEIKPVGIQAYLVTNITYTITGAVVDIAFDLRLPQPVRPSSIALEIYYVNDNETTKCGIMFYVQKSSFSFNIEGLNIVETDKKVLSNCYMWRLVSPNYQGAFEFNVAKNGGTVSSFNIFCTYKPYTPFIKVAPNFDYLYGKEFKDNRGLICAGDFSLPRITSAWESYELQNKNYQNIFNREIQHLDFMQSIEMRNQLVSGAVGIVADTAKGAGAGAYVGGAIGGAIGGVLGGATSAIGYGIDVDTLARTQRENKQLAIDKFNYQLGNIKALPYTLTKVGSFDIISKIFPFVETYCCSDEELTAFRNKIRYDSMTVMRIGTLSEFKNFNGELNYFKGSLIRNDEIADDPHTLNAIYEELLKGVYI